MKKEETLWRPGDRKRLLAYAKPYAFSFILVFVLILLSTGLRLYQPRVIQRLIDEAVPGLLGPGAGAEAEGLARHLSGVYLGTVLGQFAVSLCSALLLQHTGQKILLTIRQETWEHLMKLPVSFFDRTPQGSLVTRVTNDTETLNEIFTSVLQSLVSNSVMLAGIIFMMYRMDPVIATWVLLLLPLILLASLVFRNVIRKVYREERRLLSLINTRLSENLSGMRTIQSFHCEEAVHAAFSEVNGAYLEQAEKEVKSYAVYRPVIEILRSLGLAMLFWLGGKEYLEGVVSFGVLYAFIDYVQRFFQPILQLAETYNLIQSAHTSTGRIFRLLDEPEEEEGGTLLPPEEGFRGEIEFSHVWFAYEPGEWVLKDVSFHVDPGEFVAFVGATGAGKSTVMHLLCRFYDPDKGEIFLDGQPLKDYNLRALRQAVGVVQQEVFLYSGTVLENITLGRPEVTPEMAREAARTVNAEGFINRLPERYEETLGERGSTLSAGERQLLSFARTLASKPSLLILDEATANIDTETELLIQEAIGRMSAGHSMLAVAHRISTIADADRILVMQKGEIVEEGSCEELLAQDGIFRVLYELQYREAGDEA